jgi:peroxiredoxin
MRFVKISAVAFAFALGAGTASACTLEAAAECGGMTAEKVVNVATTTASSDCATACGASVKATQTVAEAGAACSEIAKVINVATTAASSDCATACGSSVKAAQTVAEAGAESRSVPGGGVEVVQTATATDRVGYEIGDKIENFTLKHAQSGDMVSLKDLAGEKATVIIFWNNLCPWVEGGRHASGDRVREMVRDYAEKGVQVIGIDPGIDKSEEDLIEYASTQPFPILINRDSSMAARFNAGYTPHTFIMDGNWELVYKGGFDSGARRADNGDVHHWARNAVDEILDGQTPSVAVTRGTGCTIKWAPGARPST